MLVDNNYTVPNCDCVLDHHSLLSLSTALESDLSRRSQSRFKNDVLKLAKKLKLHGWDTISPSFCSSNINVRKLSGATTNSVYVVSQNNATNGKRSRNDSANPNLPLSLILRVYGPGTEDLIEREMELRILERLARKNLGPRVLGTFTNGRFEEYLTARPMTVKEMCEVETSSHIAQSLRELHDGFDLLGEELDAGPFVWSIWDKWMERCEEVCTLLDHEILRCNNISSQGRGKSWRERGFVCGVKWSVFKGAVERYKAFCDAAYGGPEGTRSRMVFSHNDVKSENILVLEPVDGGTSAQTLRELVLIDFEYGGANVRGFDFANHFIEWCYNYQDGDDPTAFHENCYPTPAEQRQFIEAYVRHIPKNGIGCPTYVDGETSSQRQHTDVECERAVQKEVETLLAETRLWRAATSILWVAWAIVQANLDKVLGNFDTLEDDVNPIVPVQTDARFFELTSSRSETYKEHNEPPSVFVDKDKGMNGDSSNIHAAEQIRDTESESEKEVGFDYLGCAQDRVLVFWADVVSLGVVSALELPEDLLRRIKYCDTPK